MRCDLATCNIHLIWLAQTMLAEICRHDYTIPHEEQGGYLCAAQASNSLIILRCLIGRTHPEKRDRYYQDSLRGVNYVLTHAPCTSLQGRDPQKGIWGGSIRAGNWVLGFNGLSELNNEALTIGMAYAGSLIDKRVAQNLALTNKNAMARQLIEKSALIVLPQLPFIS